jgi:uncharacterized surface protein with fasciclin (FAS1) repeats
MKKKIWKSFKKLGLKTLIILVGCLWLISCHDDYELDNKEPEWLGESIYDYLNEDGDYSLFIKLIDDVKYTEVLSKTGSKTVFAADDKAFERFFANNAWGVTSYNDLTIKQKKMLLNFAMINNAYLIETLSNYYNGALNIGTAIRRSSSVSVIDDVSFENGASLPNKSWWNLYRTNGIYLLKDASDWPIVHFLQSNLSNAGISNSDFKLITGVDRSNNDAHIFDIKIIERDITCKNGYIHILEDVLFPKTNIAEYLHQNSNTQIFSGLLDRFSAPYYNKAQTEAYNQNYIDQPIDSIFEKKYFSFYDGEILYPDGKEINSSLLLPFNPGRNAYTAYSSGALQADMAAVLAPTDDALNEYFESGSGSILKERYGSWENVPDAIAILLIKRHLRESFLQTVPNRFDKLTDSENSKIPASISDITGSYVGLNGVVYETNKVYSPDDYISVYGPILFSEKANVFNWAILKNEFRLYLNSLVSTYSLFVPTDQFFENYIDPLAYAKDVKAAMKYWYNTKTNSVNATVYSYDAVSGTVGDSLTVITFEYFIINRLLDILDSHIVIGDVESGSPYYFTKNGNALKIQGSGSGLKVQGGNDIKNNVSSNVISGGVFTQENGKTYFIDKPIQTPLQSVYKVLSETPEFSEFFKLLNDISSSGSKIFVKKTNFYGMDFNIAFFNTFNYTVYVPTNEAILKAISDSVIHDWAYINSITDEGVRDEEIKNLERFIRYHFQDNSIYIGGDAVSATYQTATIKTDDSESYFDTYKNKYYKLGVNTNGLSLTLTTENAGSAKVITENGVYNIMARDYIFSDNPQAFSEADGTGVGKDFRTSSITTSSTSVIHQIDNVLNFK